MWVEDRAGRTICPVGMTGVSLALSFMHPELLYLNDVAPKTSHLAT